MSDQEKDKLLQQLKDALVAIRKLKSDLKEERLKNSGSIAIIGMSMRFPGEVYNAEDYWNLLANGIDAISDIPADRFSVDELYDAELSVKGKINVRQGGFIKDVDKFDSSFFDITPLELESMDPQQRVLLELTHEAFENSGLDVSELIGSNTGVYVGVSSSDYQVRHFRSGDYKLVGPYAYTGASVSALAGRISYMMGLEGPSISLDTACSSSIIAAHLGAQALRAGECNLAVIGGVNLILEPEMTICFSNLNALSPDSRCKTFDNSANGYVRSEGSGVMILKRLSDAQRDGDNVLAVIKGSAINQDGRSNGFTAPNVAAQADLIRKALNDAGLQPEGIGCVEAHGTGTKIGDPIEIEALSNVFKAHKSKSDPLYVGSVKSNMGHLESAAGMASMIKAVLSLQHNQIPQSIHFKQPNELINWDALPIQVPTKLSDFPSANKNIGISGFGITGTNGHIIIGEADEIIEEANSDASAKKDHGGLLLLPLSAKSPEALQALSQSYASFIKDSQYSGEDICHFTALRRAQFNLRKLFVAKDSNDLVVQLEEYGKASVIKSRKYDEDDAPRTVFVFSGQGAQWPQMGLALAACDSVFKQALEACNEALSKYVSWDLFEELEKNQDHTRLKEGDVMQPALMAIGIALGKWWMHHGIEPDVVIGHSMGEIAAAHIGGHISLDEAAKVVVNRSKLMEEQAGKGLMLATNLTLEEAEKKVAAYDGRLSISVVNSPSTIVIGGESSAIEELQKQLEGEDRWCRKVAMTVAAHTIQMDPVLEPLRAALENLQPIDGSVEYYSTSKNQTVKGSQLNADYWVQNVRSSVQFGAAIQQLAEEQPSIFIELGPHAILTAAMDDNLQVLAEGLSSSVVSSFYKEKDEVHDLYQNLGVLYELGIDLDWSKTHEPSSEFIILPNYPWQRERYWFDEEPEFKNLPSKKKADKAISAYQYSWEPATLDSEGENKNLLFINPNMADVSQLATALENAGNEVKFSISLDTEQLDSIDEIILVHPAASKEPSDLILRKEIEACLILQAIIQKLTESGHSKLPLISLLTQRATAFEGGEVSVSGALLLGMFRSLRNEYPELSGKAIDTRELDDEGSAAAIISGNAREYRILDQVLAEPRLVPYTNPTFGDIEIGPNSCFLITGGTSGLGLAFAEWLAKAGVQKIALVSRSGEKPETAAVAKRISERGSTVKIFKGDVSSMPGLMELIGSIEVSMGPITGVVHAAGLVEDGTIRSLTKEQFLNVTAPKVSGSWNLNSAFKDYQLTHFIAFSSAATTLGTIGQANYNAANFYIDQLMWWRKQNGLAATAVNWGNIGGVGMAVAQENRGDRLQAMGLNAIQPEEFDTYFQAVFQTSEHQIIPMKIDFDLWSKAYPALKADRTFSHVLQDKSHDEGSNTAHSWGDSLPVASRKIKNMIKAQVAEITKIPVAKLKDDDTFKNMGLDSMLALQLRNKIQEISQLNLPVSSIWAHPTIDKYTAFLIGELKLEGSFRSDAKVEKVKLSAHRAKELVKESISGTTKLPINRIKETDTFKSMGIDSMQALQIKNYIQSQAGITLAASSIWAHPTVEKYAAFLLTQLSGEDTAKESKEDSHEISSEVEDLSLDELMQQLDDKSKEH